VEGGQDDRDPRRAGRRRATSPALQPFGAVPPLVTDIDLSVDDKFLYVSCWGTGEFRQYDVSDPFHPKLTGSVHLGGIVHKGAHPAAGPRSTAAHRWWRSAADGKRIYVTKLALCLLGRPFYPEASGAGS